MTEILGEALCPQAAFGTTPHLQAMSLFAGAGGLDIGVDNAGYSTCCSIELDAHCVSTLRRNNSSKSVWQEDIQNVDPRRIAADVGIREGTLALLHGGPPCQPFSQIGKREGLADPRGQLVFEMVRFAEALRPTAVLIEQVPKFIKTQASSDMTVLDVLRDVFFSLGYDLHVSILDAADFDVPQHRRRAILVCVPCGQDYRFPLGNLGVEVTVGDAIADLPKASLPDQPALIPNHVDVTPERDRYRISFVPEGQWLSKVADAPMEAKQRLTAKDSTKFRRVDRRKPSLTLRCGEALYHPIQDRYLTPRESARIQGFPDSYVFEGPIRRRTGVARNLDQHRQIANAAPPPLINSVASSIRASLCL